MKVIVNTAGFYGGTWYESDPEEREIPDKVAKPFLPPYGNQLSTPSTKKSTQAGGAKPDDKKGD